MFKNRPEVIDPEEKNITYYSYRSKEEKRLEETSCCKKGKSFRPHFMMMVGLLIMVGVLYFLAQRNLEKKGEAPVEISGSGYRAVLSTYYVPEQRRVYAQLLLSNDLETPQILVLHQAHFLIFGKEEAVLAEQKLDSRKIELPEKGIQNLNIEIESSEKPKKVKVFLNLNGKDWALEKKF